MRPATGENIATHPKTCAAGYPIISILFTIAIADVIRFIFKSVNATRTAVSRIKCNVSLFQRQPIQWPSPLPAFSIRGFDEGGH
ncbi:hypothetical protein WL02_21165 [Burkholderia ubonensis]|nr:hypothetical protein WL02_21165 [Burkholderia ubonensis]